MDSKTLAHVSGELIAFAGLAVYFQRKCSFLEDRVKKLEDENIEIIENMENLNQGLTTIADMLRNGGYSHGHNNSHSHSHKTPQHFKQPQNNTSLAISPNPLIKQTSLHDNNNNTVPTLKKENESETSEANEESLSNDPDLRKELERIQKERKSDENSCAGGVCKIDIKN